MPVGLTFAGRAYDDEKLLAWVNAYEKTSRMRTTPRYTPKLSVDEGRPTGMNEQGVQAVSRPNLEIDLCSALPDTQGSLQIHIQGRIWQERIENPRETPPVVEIIVDGEDVSPESVNIGDYRDDGLVTFSSVISCPAPVERNEREAAAALVARDLTMVVVLGRSVAGGRPSGYLGLV
jgi:hypothetical protein